MSIVYWPLGHEYAFANGMIFGALIIVPLILGIVIGKCNG